jgi:RNA polymerase sigma factor (sigma-70 family)
MTASQRRDSDHAGLQNAQRAGRSPPVPGRIGDAPPVAHLVRCAREGDQRAWDALVERYAPLIWSICHAYQLGGADADDVGQNVWLQLADKLGDVLDPAALAGWIATTTRRECARILRAAQKSQAARCVPDTQKIPHEPGVMAEQELPSAERSAALLEAFASLAPACQRLIALLTEDPPVPYAEISARLGIPVDSIGPSRHRCLDKLRRHPAIAALINTEPDSAAGKEHGQVAPASSRPAGLTRQ